MRLVRAKHVLLTAAAMLSLFVSAVSACACSHHEPVKQAVESSSCHGSSHEAPPSEQPDLSAAHFESDCSCFVRTQVPAIVAKKDDKRSTLEKQTIEVPELPWSIAVETGITDKTEAAFEAPRSNYQHALLASLPSRAPPRL